MARACDIIAVPGNPLARGAEMKSSLCKQAGVLFAVILGCSFSVADSTAQQRVRARELGIWFDGAPGPLNAITDVDGVRVGHTTLIEGTGALNVGEGPVRTGVTVIFPRGDASDPVFAGWFALNGNGEMTGTTWVEESGFLEGPIGITNTHSVGVVRDAIIEWQARTGALFQPWSLPVVAETYDGWLNDINGFHVRPEHVFAALDGATSGPVAEGGVGGGTGMICYGFKGGIGTASRRLADDAGGYTVGVLVQANFGGRALLRIDGVPVGRELATYGRDAPLDAPLSAPQPGAAGPFDPFAGDGSIIIVVATDAPLVSHQLERLARRASLGVARTGSISSNGSGDIFVAFSTANAGAAAGNGPAAIQMVRNSRITPIFNATVQATEEAIINALVAAQTMVGRDGHQIVALPHDRLRELLREYNRLQ
jgi:L-aminopeptidase/D-esterase-like protein